MAHDQYIQGTIGFGHYRVCTNGIAYSDALWHLATTWRDGVAENRPSWQERTLLIGTDESREEFKRLLLSALILKWSIIHMYIVMLLPLEEIKCLKKSLIFVLVWFKFVLQNALIQTPSTFRFFAYISLNRYNKHRSHFSLPRVRINPRLALNPALRSLRPMSVFSRHSRSSCRGNSDF